MGISYQLRTDKWHTVAWNFFLFPRRVTINISATRSISWRRIGLFPGWGTFRSKKNTFVCFGIVQVKSRENRTCTVSKRGEAYVYDEITHTEDYQVKIISKDARSSSTLLP